METMKMNIDGTIRAKVLQYKSDGNTLTEKWYTLTKFAEGIYFSYTDTDRYGHRSVNIIFSKNGIFWRIGGEPEHYFNPDSFRYAENMETIKKRFANYEADILQAAANGGWLNKLHITVMERLGHDVAPLLAAYEEHKRKWEENERKRIEAAEKAERERKKAEECRKAELLAEGKEKLTANKAVTVEQIELLAEAVGYKIHIRTIGFMREKVSEAVLNTDETVTVWGRKLTQRNISGTADVLREIAARIKAQAEQEAQQPATTAEMPQISTETAEAVNVSAEGEKREETAKYRIFRYRSDGFEKVTIGDKLQCRVICILSTFKGKSYIEIGNTTIGVGTGGQQLIEVSRSITDMSDAELIDIMLNTKVSHNIYEDKIYPYSYFVNEDTPQPPKNAPQSTQTAKPIKCTSHTRKRA